MCRFGGRIGRHCSADRCASRARPVVGRERLSQVLFVLKRSEAKEALPSRCTREKKREEKRREGNSEILLTVWLNGVLKHSWSFHLICFDSEDSDRSTRVDWLDMLWTLLPSR